MAETLHPYQLEGANFLASRHTALLADVMGVGKSAQAIHAANLVKANSILVICPAIARINWTREFEKFSETKYNFKIINSRKEADIAQSNNEPFIVVSYDLASVCSDRFKRSFDVLVLDEAHYLKSKTAKRTIEILGSQGIVRHTKRIWALTGTPAPNHAGELWPILCTFGATKLTYNQFIERYCTYIETTYGRQITGTNEKQIPELKKTLQPIMLRRTKDDVALQLPRITSAYIYVDPAPVDLMIHDSFIKWVFPVDRRLELFKLLEEQKKVLELLLNNTLENINLMRALEATATSLATLRMYNGLQKAVQIAKLVAEELENGAYKKIVLFAIHRDTIETMRAQLKKYGAVTIYGGTEPSSRQKNIDNFQNNPKCKVIICNIVAAGTAINLTAASDAIFVEQDWVPGNNAQAAMRVHRIGQTKNVHIRYCSLTDSVDQKITSTLKKKSMQLTALFDDNKPRKKPGVKYGTNDQSK